MAQTDKNSDSLNEDKLKPEMEILAAKILQENKNVKKVEIKAKIETKTTRTGEKSEKGGAGPLGRPENMGGIGKPGSMGPIGQSEKASGGEQDGENKGGDGEKQSKEESDKKEPGGKQPAEANQPKEKPGSSAGSQQAGQDEEDGGEGKPEDKAEAGKRPEGDARENEQKPNQDGEKQGRGSDNKEEAKAGAGEREKSKQGDWQPGGRTKESDDLDSRLLNPDQENDAAGKLREKKKNKDGEEGGDKPGAADEPQSLRQRVMQAKNLKEQAKKKLEEKVLSPAKQGTSYLLKAAWLNVIDSFGLTLIYINTHVFLRWVFPDLFCKLGDEWMPKIVAGQSSEKNVAGTAFGIIEVVGLLIIDLIILFIIFMALAQIVMIVNFMGKSLWGKLGDLWDAFWGLGWGGIKALTDLFSSIK